MRVSGYAALLAFLPVVFLYATGSGGERYVSYTDSALAVYSFLCVAVSFSSWRLFGNNKHRQSLGLILFGIATWSLAEIIWFFFPVKAYYISESLRLAGNIPLVFGFFFIMREANPQYAEHRNYIIMALTLFVILVAIYLIFFPLALGQSIWEIVSVGGYIFADLILVYGIIFLLILSYQTRQTAMGTAWLVFAMAFLSVFAFDLFFALFTQRYYFGHPAEVLVVLNYLLVALGFALAPEHAE
jgi:hypothetical protein